VNQQVVKWFDKRAHRRRTWTVHQLGRLISSAPVCTVYATSYMLPSAQPRPQPIRHLVRFGRFRRAHYCNRQTDGQTMLLGL